MSYSECTYHGEQESYHCGYCEGKKQKSRCTHGASFSTLTTKDYQSLMFRGWRRSGDYCYKPVMREICCPQYTIRCDVGRYRLSRSHRRVLRRMNEFLRSGETPKANNKAATGASAATASRQANNSNIGESRPVETTAAWKMAPFRVAGAFGLAKRARNAGKAAAAAASGDGADPETSLKATLSAYRARRAARAAARAPKSLDQMLQPPAEAKHRLRVVLLPSAKREFDSKSEHSLYERYQMRIHGDSKADCDYRQFYRFLCKSPLVYAKRNNRWIGSFHQQYWLEPENRLIMVGVVDILPDCTSSVYVFYDPDYAWLNLGTYAALREIQLTKQLGLPHYCMGYYIHDCVKMRYKGAFEGSELLCPETYTWHCLQTVCAPKLDLSGYCRFAPSDVPDAISAPVPVSELQVALGHGSANFMPYSQMERMLSGRPSLLAMLAELAAEFARLVGPECARRIRVRFC
uniref:Arginyl-tRNA--protein transferase 1 n=1 Tax=Macrostomum lignano TaxID=282301 RepID=A0A1I8IA80_9PLAT